MRHLRDMQPKVITELKDRDFICRDTKDDTDDIVINMIICTRHFTISITLKRY